MQLQEVGDFTTELATKQTLQIYLKLSYEALNRHFCQTAVPVAQLHVQLYGKWLKYWL